MTAGRDNKGRFITGHKETVEDKLKRIESCKNAWRTRSDYIGDLKQKNPKLYNIWRAFMFTKKGKLIGHSEAWNSFKQFFEDVQPTYRVGCVFRRKDTTLPFSKTNFMWLTKDQLSGLYSNKRLSYKGEIRTLKEWSILLGINYAALQQRYAKGKNYTSEEILFGKPRVSKKEIKDIYELKEEQKRKNKISKMLSAYRCKDKKRGCTTTITRKYLEDIIYNGKCIYCGDTKNIGLDRIDNSRGHEIGNVVPCCYDCNVARNNNFSFEEMLKIGKVIKKIKKDRNENSCK